MESFSNEVPVCKLRVFGCMEKPKGARGIPPFALLGVNDGV